MKKIQLFGSVILILGSLVGAFFYLKADLDARKAEIVALEGVYEARRASIDALVSDLNAKDKALEAALKELNDQVAVERARLTELTRRTPWLAQQDKARQIRVWSVKQ